MAADVREDAAETSMNQFETAAEEWNNVAEITLSTSDTPGHGHSATSGQCQVSPLVTMADVTHYLNTKPDMVQYLHQVKTSSSTNRRGVRSLLCCLLSPPSLPPHLRTTARQVQATALIPFCNDDPVHLGMLHTIYRQLTCTTLNCPRYGSHWEQIGFQGTDPSTDLRGVGVLGLVHVIYLVTTPEMLPFCRDVYQLSRVEGHEFPFLVLSLNITRITLHVLRDGLLNKHIKLEDDVWATFNFYYACLMYHVYITWKSKRLTIRDCGDLLKQTETTAR